jgi:hypothetical protein
VRQLPDVSTISRTLAAVDGKSVSRVRQELRADVLERLRQAQDLPRFRGRCALSETVS